MRNLRRSGFAAVAALVLVFVMAFAGCDGAGTGGGGGATGGDADTQATEGGGVSDNGAYALYKAASEAMNSAEGYEMDIKAESFIEMNGEKSDTVTESHSAVNDPRGNIEMKSVTKTGMAGDMIDTVSYLKDSVLYTETMGQKISMKLDMSQLGSYANSALEFEETAMIDGDITDVDGGKQVTFKIKGDAIADFIKKQSGGMNLGDAISDVGMEFGDAMVTAVIGADGVMTECITEFSYSMTQEDFTLSMTQKSTSTNIKLGKVQIDFPDDLDSYQEFDMNALAGDEIVEEDLELQ
jgi:hypothetical protein